MRNLIRRLVVMAIASSAWAAPLPASAMPVPGNIYTVNSTLDEPDADPVNGTCASTPSGLCTLRAAIMEANDHAGADTILLAAGIYTLTRAGLDDQAVVGDLDISNDLTLQGAGSGSTIVDGNGAVTSDRVFEVLDAARNVTFSGLTIQHGLMLTTELGIGQGGGIYLDGGANLLLDHVVIEGNQAGEGGGFYAYAHDLLTPSNVELRDSQVYSNTAVVAGGGVWLSSDTGFAPAQIVRTEIYSNDSSFGAGIFNAMELSLSDSLIHDNHASYTGGGLASDLPMTIARTTLSANTADYFGGGIAYFGRTSMGQLALTNSTLSGNIAHKNGGGLYVRAGSLALFNTTIASNQVLYPGSSASGLGAGLYLTASTVLVARNSIIANNLRLSRRGVQDPDDCFSADSTGGLYYNLITSMADCTIIIGGQIGNIVGPDPLLGPLQDHGGATPTLALLPGSPAIDAGDPSNGCTGLAGALLTTDQRGAARSDARCDIGAYEVVPEGNLALTQHASPGPARVGALLTYTLTIANIGSGLATGVVVTDKPPLSATLWAATPSQGSCLGAVLISCNLGSLANGASLTITVAVTPTAAGELNNWVSVTANEFDVALADNTGSETTVIQSELYLPLLRRGP